MGFEVLSQTHGPFLHNSSRDLFVVVSLRIAQNTFRSALVFTHYMIRSCHVQVRRSGFSFVLKAYRFFAGFLCELQGRQLTYYYYYYFNVTVSY